MEVVQDIMKATLIRKSAFLAVVFLVGVSGACASPVANQYTPTEQTTSTPSQESSIETPIKTPSPQVAATNTQIPTMTETAVPVASGTATPEMSAIETQMAALPDSETWTNTSPDGKWIAEGRAKIGTGIIVGDNELYYVQLTVVSEDQSTQWILIDEVDNYGLGYTIPQVLHWSPDGHYLYYTNRPRIDGCGLFVTASDLWQVDLADGEITQVFPEGAQSYSFSPDGNQLAMMTWSTPPELVIHKLPSGEQQVITLDFDDAGAMVWSPDGDTIAMTIANKPCHPGWAQGILLLDMNTLTPTVILEPDERLLQTTDWPETGKIILKDREDALYWINTISGEIESIQ